MVLMLELLRGAFLYYWAPISIGVAIVLFGIRSGRIWPVLLSHVALSVYVFLDETHAEVPDPDVVWAFGVFVRLIFANLLLLASYLVCLLVCSLPYFFHRRENQHSSVHKDDTTPPAECQKQHVTFHLRLAMFVITSIAMVVIVVLAVVAVTSTYDDTPRCLVKEIESSRILREVQQTPQCVIITKIPWSIPSTMLYAQVSAVAKSWEEKGRDGITFYCIDLSRQHPEFVDQWLRSFPNVSLDQQKGIGEIICMRQGVPVRVISGVSIRKMVTQENVMKFPATEVIDELITKAFAEGKKKNRTETKQGPGKTPG